MVYDRKLTELSSGEVDFGLRDKQGRAVGYKWQVYQAVFTPIPVDPNAKYGPSGYTDPAKWHKPMPHEHITIRAYPTRNGRHYGASGNDLHALTEDEAKKLIAKRVEQARKRDTKKFASTTTAQLLKDDAFSDAAFGWKGSKATK
jgi:hypothetical protein